MERKSKNVQTLVIKSVYNYKGLKKNQKTCHIRHTNNGGGGGAARESSVGYFVRKMYDVVSDVGLQQKQMISFSIINKVRC